MDIESVFDAAAAVTSALGLLAFVAAGVLVWQLYRLRHQNKQLALLPDEERTQQVDDFLTRYKITGEKLSATRKFQLIQEEMARRRFWLRVVFLLVLTLAGVVCFGIAVFGDRSDSVLDEAPQGNLDKRHIEVKAAIANGELDKAVSLSEAIVEDHSFSSRAYYNLACAHALLAQKAPHRSEEEGFHLIESEESLKYSLEYGITSYIKLNLNEPKPVQWIKAQDDIGFLLTERAGARVILDSFSSEDTPTLSACVQEDMKVALADGTRARIASIEVGDTIVAYDIALRKRVVGEVVSTSSSTADCFVRVNGRLLVTPAHPIYTKKGWLPAGELAIDSAVLCESGRYETITSVEMLRESHEVVDLAVEPSNTFVVAGIVVHNKPISGPYYVEQTSSSPPFNAICSLRVTTQSGQQYDGGGVLVGPHLIITAGSLLYHHEDGRFVKSVDITFPTLPDSSEAITWNRLRVSPAWRDSRLTGFDYGAVSLAATPAGAEPVAVIALSDLDLEGARCFLVCFPAEGRMFLTDGDVYAIDSMRIRYTSEFPISDGTPVFVGQSIVGLNVADYLGVRFTAPRIEMINEWIQESEKDAQGAK